MRAYRDRAVVIRQHKLGEADLIITLLTRRNGLVRAVAKGLRRTKSKFGARLEPFAHIDVTLHPGRSLDIIGSVTLLRAFGAELAGDYERYTAASAVLETAERLAGEERAPAPDLERLTVRALAAIVDGERAPQIVLDTFLLRAMSSAGWGPALDECARCGSAGPHRAFHVAAGGSVCQYCRPSDAMVPRTGVVELLSAYERGAWDEAAQFDPSLIDPASRLVAAYLQWHLERGLRTLPLVRQAAAASVPLPVRQDEDRESPTKRPA